MPENNPQPSPALIEEVLQLMNLSSMSQEERTMWTMMLPSMTDLEINKLKGALETEVRKMTDIYLKAQAAMAKENKK